MKLKTLKDLKYVKKKGANTFCNEVVDYNLLKAEAVKWMKESDKIVEEDKDANLREFWMDRFNLIEEDLE